MICYSVAVRRKTTSSSFKSHSDEKLKIDHDIIYCFIVVVAVVSTFGFLTFFLDIYIIIEKKI